ncbi:MAG TPA: hypothetical protein VF258_05545 [Luteolibacter sp.]
MKTATHRPNTYLARDTESLSNGSFFRKTTRKNEYAQYVNGDFLHFVTELPEGLSLTITRRDAVKHLPAGNR